ncbi:MULTISPECIES: VOC family protein [Pseudoalteromonas]|uniref:VOC family protein n=1 Tax=Pseudoalteromonas obscura TaxID=3048491 RepID=A0ABT7EGT5_9GAMM|nr:MULTISPECIES: VOC family protein [Pseudoalteromonas]MBQ4835521.1 VOC family protein [Pseudoalteromonas luteoviolacea]MDK2594238.1 VOC family protein [Pseudoalteromonas sp. P94(2023)]
MKMNYFVVGTNNMSAAVNFYNALFEQTPFKQTMANHRMTFWQGDEPDSAFAVATPFNGEVATNGNGTMLGFNVDSATEVTRLYNKALALGGTCEGEPRQRGPKFSAYVRDLDNNKLVFGD